MLYEIQPLRERRFLSTARTTTTVTTTAAATPPTVPPTTKDIELGAASDDAEVELALKFKRLGHAKLELILLSVNSSLTNLGTYSQKHTNRKRKHKYFTKITI